MQQKCRSGTPRVPKGQTERQQLPGAAERLQFFLPEQKRRMTTRTAASRCQTQWQPLFPDFFSYREMIKTGIEKSGLGSYQSGDANQMPSILSQNSNFKEVKIKSDDLDKLPAGCIICYAPGDCNYDRRYGHVETTDGNGNAISFFVNDNIKKSDNVRVFVPV